MSLALHPPPSAETPAGTTLPLRFLPRTLAAKCRRLIKSQHDIRGYAVLADILWHADARALIAQHESLDALFRRASTTRSAKEADECYVQITTAILVLEVLASDFDGWGRRFPRARRLAIEIVERDLKNSRTRLLDMYVFGAPRRPRIPIRRPGSL